jgi:large subunit ribosomal protein L10
VSCLYKVNTRQGFNNFAGRLYQESMLLLTLEEKKAIVAEMSVVAGSALSAIAAEYRGLQAADIAQLRAEARKTGVYLRVVKNTLARRAVEGTEFSCMQSALAGPLMLAFSQEDPAAGARLLRDFAKSNDKLVVKAIAMGGKLMGPGELDALAKMPTRNQAISLLMAVMKAPVEKLARTLAAVRDQKQSSAG